MGILDKYKAQLDVRQLTEWTRDEWKKVILEVQITPDTMLTIGEAAYFVGHKHGLHDGAIKTLCNQMMNAIGNGLTVRHPHTDLPYVPKDKRWFYELVRADELDSWFESLKVAYRIQSQAVPAAVAQTEPGANTIKKSAPVANEAMNWDVQEITDEVAISWLKKPCWSIAEMALLLGGWGAPNNKYAGNPLPPICAPNGGEQMDRLSRAAMAGQLKPVGQASGGFSMYSPMDLLTVAEVIDFGNWQYWKELQEQLIEGKKVAPSAEVDVVPATKPAVESQDTGDTLKTAGELLGGLALAYGYARVKMEDAAIGALENSPWAQKTLQEIVEIKNKLSTASTKQVEKVEAVPNAEVTTPQEVTEEVPKEISDRTELPEIVPHEYTPEICAMFDPLNKEGLIKLFPIESVNWESVISHAGRNGLSKAKEKKGIYNPAKVASWLIQKGKITQAHANGKLRNALPPRSKHLASVFANEAD